jgi:hypothetical protein
MPASPAPSLLVRQTLLLQGKPALLLSRDKTLWLPSIQNRRPRSCGNTSRGKITTIHTNTHQGQCIGVVAHGDALVGVVAQHLHEEVDPHLVEGVSHVDVHVYSWPLRVQVPAAGHGHQRTECDTRMIILEQLDAKIGVACA